MRTLRVGLRAAYRSPPRRGVAPTWPATTHKSTRSGLRSRWAFTYATQGDRITTPLIRGEDGTLVQASWSEALTVAAKGLSAAYGNAGVLVGGRATLEDAYAYGKFTRVVLGSNDIDFRARSHSAEESEFLAARIAGQPITVTYADLEAAPVVLLAGFEPEEESPIVFLRLRKAPRKHRTEIYSVAPFATRGLTKMSGTLLQSAPGGEASLLDELQNGEFAEILSASAAVIMLGERLASSPGALSAAVRLADSTGARLVWVPRRAGERGALGGRRAILDAARRSAGGPSPGAVTGQLGVECHGPCPRRRVVTPPKSSPVQMLSAR